ncbi:hypothetical protein [Frigoribacterium sp. MCBA15_019]|uniref:hypothetical protein n=1 Tax=Frigoribacterium sp. MCBA15_019 TaxID=1898745 RepID=UPI0008DD0942|nr:hypothetical protein [Frigoribacterium sp. MCBA15_019]OII27115.1 hypothetical protein BIV04_00525 [Frigoribacterium sp. MCBA15_019]
MTLTSVLATTLDRPPADAIGSRDASDPAGVADPHAPVRDVRDLVRHVEAIVPVAVRRQLWTLFFDDDDVPLPLMVPLEGIPEVPDTSALDHYGDALAAVATEFGAGTVAFVLERVGAATPRPSDRRWAEGLHALGRGRPFEVRPVLLCVDDGVSVLDPISGTEARVARGGVPQASSSPVRLVDIVRLP